MQCHTAHAMLSKGYDSFLTFGDDILDEGKYHLVTYVQNLQYAYLR